MNTTTINYTAHYEINARLGIGVEVGFYADIAPNDNPLKTTYIRVENNEPDAFHGILTIDREKGVVRFGYDIIFIEQPFKIVTESDGLCELGISVLGTDIVISIKAKK